MTDMSIEQRAAAKRALGRFPVRFDLTRDNDVSTITPMRNGMSGTPVRITSTMHPSQVEKEIAASCKSLMEG